MKLGARPRPLIPGVITRRPGAQDTTKGPILGTLVALAGPIVATNIFQTLYQLIDTFWVGRLGASAVAAVSVSFPILFLMISAGGGMAVAGAILVAQTFGSGDEEAVDHAAGQTLLAVGIVSAALSAAGFFLAEPMITLFGVEPDVANLAVDYLQISFLGLVAVFVYFVFQALLRSVGDVKTPMIVVAGTVVLNFFADPLLILGFGPVPGLGVAGAAWATIFAQGLAGVVGLGILFSGRYSVRLEARHFIPDRSVILKILRLGIPSSIEQSTRALGIGVMMLLVAGFGTTVIASYGIGTRILSFIIVPGMGLAVATSTVVGQNVGARKDERATLVARVGMTVGFVALTTAGILLFLLAAPVVRTFVPGEPEVVELGARFIRIMAPAFGFLGIQIVMSGALAGAGNTIAAMGLSIMAFWVLRFPVAWVLAIVLGRGPEGIFWSFPISNLASACIAMAWFYRGTWIRRIVDGESMVREAVRGEAQVEEGIPDG